MAKVASGFRNLTKTALVWATLIAIAASLYGALLAGQPAPRTLEFAHDTETNSASVVAASVDQDTIP